MLIGSPDRHFTPWSSATSRLRKIIRRLRSSQLQQRFCLLTLAAFKVVEKLVQCLAERKRIKEGFDWNASVETRPATDALRIDPDEAEQWMSRLNTKESLPNCTEIGNSDAEIRNEQPPLTDSSDKGYICFSSLPAGVAKLAYAADSKSAGT